MAPLATPTPTTTPTLAPTPSPTAAPVKAWTTRAVTVLAQALPSAQVEVHLGPSFPVTLTNRQAVVGAALMWEAIWETSARAAIGWIPDEAITLVKPSGRPAAGVDALDQDLEKYLESFGTRVGLDVLDLTRGVSYTYNADEYFYMASSMKVPIMLTLMSQIEAGGKLPSALQKSQLREMIEFSNNAVAQTLYNQIGADKGVKAFLKKIAFSGLQPQLAKYGWGVSSIQPRAMVDLLDRLYEGKILNKYDRDLALYYMEHIVAHQRVGVGDSSPAGAMVAMKDGWTNVHGPAGPSIMNTSGIVTVGGETYIISVYTDRDRDWGEGFKIVRHVCSIVGRRLTAS